jgi:hypothetical protein
MYFNLNPRTSFLNTVSPALGNASLKDGCTLVFKIVLNAWIGDWVDRLVDGLKEKEMEEDEKGGTYTVQR